jgi:hypothetical protein
MRRLLVLAVLFAGAPIEAQDPAIDKAVEKAAAFLKKSQATHYPEMQLWALVNAGVDEKDTDFQNRLKLIEKAPVYGTYQTALRALVFAKLDPPKYAPQLRACAQFFVDTQSAGGQWSYGHHRVDVDPEAKDGVKFERAPQKRRCRREPEELKPVLDAEVKARGRAGASGGDNSNTQFAALGIFACSQAGIRFPKDVIERAKRWWESAQNPDGGWDYQKRGSSYGTMTTAGVAALLIYKRILKEDTTGDPAIEKGIEWLAKNFTVKGCPPWADGGGGWKFYYLYGLERVGILSGRTQIGTHKWFEEGARHLLDTQKSDGSWVGNGEDAVLATCFAVLFLKRATVEKRVPIAEKREIKKDTSPTRNELVIAQIGLRVDDDPVVPDYAKMTDELRKRVSASVRAERVPVSLVDDPLKEYPFLYVTGHEEVTLTDREMDALSKHLRRGGFLYMQNCCRSGAFERSMRALSRKLGGELGTLARDHKIYKTRYDVSGAPALEGAMVEGRLAIVYCDADLCCRWGMEECDDKCSPVSAEESFRILANIVSIAFSE